MRILTGVVLSVLLTGLVAAGCSSGSSRSSSPSPSASTSPAPTLPVSTGSAPGTVQLVSQLRPSVVQILSEAASLDIFGQVVPQQGAGTGIIIDKEGHIVTNNHVVVQPNSCNTPAQKITVTLSDGRQVSARIVGRDVPTDLAVLQVQADNLQPAQFGNSSSMAVGQDLVVIGNALNLPGGPTVTKGVLSAKGRLIEEQQCNVTIPDALQTDAAINPGNSGGPLVAMNGQVMGITTAVVSQAQGIGLAISSDSAKPIIDELIAKGKVPRGFLGVSITPVSSFAIESCGLPSGLNNGVVIAAVQQGSPAAKAGLQTCDVILKIGDIAINNTGDLFQALTAHQSGQTVQVQYQRDNETKTTPATLG